MTYDEYYDEIITLFKKSISMEDKDLYNKVFNCLIVWYQKNYEEQIKKYFQDENELAIINLSKKIYYICNLSDYDKLQEIYVCDELSKLEQLSNDIFELVKKSHTTNVSFDEGTYNSFVQAINQLEKTFPKIIINKYNTIKSECMLDLDYLLNKGNVQSYSIRTYDYLQHQAN